MPWKSETVMDQRIEFVLAAKRAEKAFSVLCREFGITRPTGYLWVRRYEQAGTAMGLKERSRTPHRMPSKTASETEDRIIELRREKGWGARKLRRLLTREEKQVSAATIHRILVRRGVIEQRPERRTATKRFERSQCNQMHQMDFKGEYDITEGKCYPLSLIDDHSRFLVGLWPLGTTGAEGVYIELRSLFRREGVPESILTDHGSAWYSTTNGHGLTWLSVWLIKQGVVLKFSAIAHPQTQGKVERFHRTLKERTAHRGLPATMSEWRSWAREFRDEYNNERPHEALQMKTPAEIYDSQNLRSYNENPPQWQYSGANVYKLSKCGNLYYHGRYYFVCEALADEKVRVDELDHLLVVTFRHMTIREIDLRTGKTAPIVLPERKYKRKVQCSSDREAGLPHYGE